MPLFGVGDDFLMRARVRRRAGQGGARHTAAGGRHGGGARVRVGGHFPPNLGATPLPVKPAAGGGELRAPCNALPEALDPLGQRLRTPAERRVDGRFVSAPRLVAGHGVFVGPLESARKPATASAKRPMSTQMSARCFAQVSCSSRLFMRPVVRRAGALARMPSAKGDKRGAPVDTRAAGRSVIAVTA